MATKTKFAVWRKVGRLYVVRPPDWPKECEYSCTSQEILQEWARNHNYMLRDGNNRRKPA